MEFGPEIEVQTIIFAPLMLGQEVAERSNFYLCGPTPCVFWSLSQHLNMTRNNNVRLGNISVDPVV
jgi:hypothetical protein